MAEIGDGRISVSVPVSDTLLIDGTVLRAWHDEIVEGLRRDLRGERVHGPKRVWEWEPVDDSYLQELSQEELLSEARRLREQLVGYLISDDDLSASYPPDRRFVEGDLRAVWTVRPYVKRP